jgi:hypothetical protein
MQYNTLAKIITALEQQGIEFTFEDGRRGVIFKG